MKVDVLLWRQRRCDQGVRMFAVSVSRSDGDGVRALAVIISTINVIPVLASFTRQASCNILDNQKNIDRVRELDHQILNILVSVFYTLRLDKRRHVSVKTFFLFW